MDKDKLRKTQIFTPQKVTNEMVDLLDQESLSSDETFFFEPTCGDGSLLVVLVDRIFNEMLKRHKDRSRALSDTLFKFYAVELDEELVPQAREKIYNWALSKLKRELTGLEKYLIAQSIRQSVEHRDFFEVMEHPIDAPAGARALSRAAKNKRER